MAPFGPLNSLRTTPPGPKALQPSLIKSGFWTRVAPSLHGRIYSGSRNSPSWARSDVQRSAQPMRSQWDIC